MRRPGVRIPSAPPFPVRSHALESPCYVASAVNTNTSWGRQPPKSWRDGHQIVRVVGETILPPIRWESFDTHSGKGRPMWLLVAGASIVVAACFFVARATVRAVADIASGTDTLG